MPGILDASLDWTVDSKEFANQAFTDSVDILSLHSTGICGEKEVTLDVSSPPFLSLVPDSSDSVLNDYKIVYDKS